MKRLVDLVLVLCLASSASAALQISVNGVKEPIDSEITIGEGEHLELGIWTDAAIEPFGAFPWMLVCDTTMGDISGGGYHFLQYQLFSDQLRIFRTLYLQRAKKASGGQSLITIRRGRTLSRQALCWLTYLISAARAWVIA